MTAPRRRAPAPLGAPLSLSLVIVVVLVTFGGFSTSFGVMQTCTDAFSCEITTCRPCVTAASWVEVGWAVQGALLTVGLVLAVLTRRGSARARCDGAAGCWVR